MAEQSEKGNYSKCNSISSNNRSSSSSISISYSSGSDTIEDSPSSSGCSFDMSQNKHRRKEKVKGFLKELKTMVNLEKPKGSRAGTLSTLEHVVNSMRKIKAKQLESDTESRSQLSREDVESGFHSNCTSQAEEVQTQSTEEDCLMMVVSPWAGIVENISQNVKAKLGYPPDVMLGRPLSEFIGTKDHSTLNNIISLNAAEMDQLDKDAADTKPSDDSKKTYFSIRTYKGLEKGYSLGPVNKFIPFEVKVCVKNLREGENLGIATMGSPSSQANVQPKLVSHGKRTCIMLRCHPLKTIYRGPQCTPEHRTFSTRHNSRFVYTTMHRNAIPLLGYLPQDFIGSSVFDYYHADDFPELYHIYQTVVSLKDKTYKSKPYRLRVKNGDYILVETEWSTVMNVWSREVEVVIGQHTIIRGPNNPNVFDCCQLYHKSEINTSNKFVLQEKIKKLLVKGLEATTGDNLFSVPKARDKKVENPRKNVSFLMDNTPDAGTPKFQERRPQSPTVSAPISPTRDVYTAGTELTYEHLNYKTSIRRFLLSQPKTFSSLESEVKSLTDLEDQDVSDEFIQATLVDFAVPKPPSFGSSTKVLVSEQEPREEIREDILITSPIAEEPVEEETMVTAEKEEAVSESQPQPAYLPVTLTQEMLRVHTKRQEKLYVQKAAQEMYLSPTFGPTCLKGPHRLKRMHSPERDTSMDRSYRCAKTLRTDIREKHSLDVLKPSFPLTPLETPGNLTDQSRAFPCWSDFNPHSALASSSYRPMKDNSLGLYSQGFPVMQLGSSSLNMPTSSAQGNMQWPYYTANATAALPFFQVYTPVTVFNGPVTLKPGPGLYTSRSRQMQGHAPGGTLSSSSVSSKAKYERKKQLKTKVNQDVQKKGQGWSESSDNMSSMEDTASSLLYLLESDSHNNSSCPEEMELSPAKHHLPVTPPWIQSCKWTEETEMRYTLPKRSISRVLKEDRDKLAKLSQPALVHQQLSDLIRQLDEENCEQTLDEEADEIIFPVAEGEALAQTEDGFSLISLDDSSVCECDKDHDHGLRKVLRSRKGKLKPKPESCEDLEESGEKQQDSSTGMSASETRSPGKLSDTADVDSTSSKESSNLTPSDQRSSEEATSSLKESDTMSKESDACCKEATSVPDVDFLEKLLTPLELKVPQICPFSKVSKLASWMVKTTFNENIQSKYQLKMESREEILAQDWKRSLEMHQSAEVKIQLQTCEAEILESLDKKPASPKQEVVQEAAVAGGSQDDDSSSCQTQLRKVIINELMGSMMSLPQQAEKSSEQSSKMELSQSEASESREAVSPVKTENKPPAKSPERDLSFEFLFMPFSEDYLEEALMTDY